MSKQANPSGGDAFPLTINRRDESSRKSDGITDDELFIKRICILILSVSSAPKHAIFIRVSIARMRISIS